MLVARADPKYRRQGPRSFLLVPLVPLVPLAWATLSSFRLVASEVPTPVATERDQRQESGAAEQTTIRGKPMYQIVRTRLIGRIDTYIQSWPI